MIKNRDIVIIGLQPWDVPIGSNCKDIALEMSRHNRVLYVNLPLDVKTIIYNFRSAAIKKRLSLLAKSSVEVPPIGHNLWMFYPRRVMLSANWIGWHKAFRIINRINNRMFARQIKKAIKKLGFKDVILFNDNDMFRGLHMKEFLKPVVSVYYSRDYLLAVPYWKKHGHLLEPEIIAKSDVCVANSLHLRDYCARYNPHSFYVGQGCDLSMYQERTPPSGEVAALHRPVIGYAGAITSLRLNIDWIREAAMRRPHWQWVMVGPAEPDCIKKLQAVPNIKLLGARPPHSLPAYIAAFDVCINPQIISDMTIGNYPRKVDEYLAMKKPVVATRTKAMEVFEPAVYLANDLESFIHSIETALQEDSPEKQQERRALAESHSWEQSVNQIYEAIEAVAHASTRTAHVAH